MPEALAQALRARGEYHTPPVAGRPRWPTLRFYPRMLAQLAGSGLLTLRHRERLSYATYQPYAERICHAVEAVGGQLHVTGFSAVLSAPNPVIFVCNHMSSLETFVLPAVLWPFRPTTFVLKESLLKYPLFGTALKALEPITVTRRDARADLKAVYEQGAERLGRGISLVIFPQSTRTDRLDPEKFNSIAVKLARRTNTPVLPVAAQTDFWGNGRWLKDFGPVRPERPVRLEFGPAFAVTQDKEAQQQLLAFIGERLDRWRVADAAAGVAPTAGESAGGAAEGKA